MPNKEICSNCNNWKPENLGAGPTNGPGTIRSGDKGNQYGKCHVSFQGNDGELKVWDSASIGSSKCIIEDDNGHSLFVPKA